MDNANTGIQDADDRNSESFLAYFKDRTSSTYVKQSLTALSLVYGADSVVAEMFCGDPPGRAHCTNWVQPLAYLRIGTIQFGLCPIFFPLEKQRYDCRPYKYDKMHVIAHELLHLYIGTQDYAFGIDKSQKLSAELARHNPDNYAYFLRSLRIEDGCF